MRPVRDDDAIGGYFALERGGGAGLPWLAGAAGYRSARAGLAAVLACARPPAVWVPHYLCGAVDEALHAAGVGVRRYRLDESLGVPVSVEPATGEMVLVIDYFGLHAAAVDAAIARFGAGRVVVDASQSLFLRPRPGAAIVYSPRKFLGVPDGGLVLANRPLPPSAIADEDESVARCGHLLCRFAGQVEAGYARFQQAEASLAGCARIGMSRLTGALLASVDGDAIAASRIRNYRGLSARLTAEGHRVPELPPAAVPLCCPVRCDGATRVRSRLAARRIYTPSYWDDAMLPDDDAVALGLRDRTVYLPCDQRYGDREMESVAHAMIESMEAA